MIWKKKQNKQLCHTNNCSLKQDVYFLHAFIFTVLVIFFWCLHGWLSVFCTSFISSELVKSFYTVIHILSCSGILVEAVYRKTGQNVFSHSIFMGTSFMNEIAGVFHWFIGSMEYWQKHVIQNQTLPVWVVILFTNFVNLFNLLSLSFLICGEKCMQLL